MPDSTKHAGDCTIYASLDNVSPECGICTCGYGLSRLRECDMSEMYSDEVREKQEADRIGRRLQQHIRP